MISRSISVSACVAIAAATTLVEAQYVFRDDRTSGTLTATSLDDLMNDPASGARSYDNWRYPGGGGGDTLVNGRVRVGAQEVGDDLNLAVWQGSVVNDIGYSVVNMAASGGGSLTGVGQHRRFYDADTGELLYTDSAFYTFVGFSLRPGEGGIGYTDGGFYRGFGIPARQRMYMTMQFFDPVGISIEDMGLFYGGPINTGSSSSLIRNFTTGQNIDLGANPQNNLIFFIDSVVVPSPSSFSLLAASSLLAVRRRR